jgi:hypothetical protein
MSLYKDASIIVTPNSVKAGKLYSIKPGNGAGDLDVVRATTKTRTNSLGVIENVPINVPALDYTNGSCPSILVEPQRTNLLTYSEQLNDASWTKTECSITANIAASPSGILNADKIIPNTTNTFHPCKKSITVSSGLAHAYTVYFKKDGYNFVLINTPTGVIGGNVGPIIDLNNGTIVGNLGGSTHNAVVTSINDGWYKVTMTFTTTGTTTIIDINTLATSSITSYSGNGTDGILVWGAQLEVGSNATSYIPTVASAVTRNADVISKTGISDLIGQTEGTLFVDFNLNKLSETKAIAVLDNGSTDEYIALTRRNTNIFRLQIKKTGSSAVNIIDSIVINDLICKIAIAYKNEDYAMYVNGTLRGTSTNSTDYPTTALTQFVLSNASYGSLNDSYNSAALWKERLSNETLAQLTTL